MCVCVLVRPLLFCTKRGKMWVLSSECKIDQTDFTNWVSFLPSNLMEEIRPNLDVHSVNTFLKLCFSTEELKKTKKRLTSEYL